MKTVREILLRKGNNVWTIGPDATVYEALKLMAEKEVGALLVLENSILHGIISERDYARKVALEGKSSRDSLVKEIMSTKILYVTLAHTTEECIALMINKRIRHLPVYENNLLVGVISIGDVVNAVIDEKEFVIDQLVRYITDTPPINNKFIKSEYKVEQKPV